MASQKHIACWWSLIGLVVYLLLAYVVYMNFIALPTALRFADESSNPHRFIGERAANVNTHFTKLGVRQFGSQANEVHAVQFLLQQIRDISDGLNANHKIEYEIQTSDDGVFPLGNLNNYYQSVQNIVVRLSPNRGALPPYTLLINSHFDTAPSSAGGADASFMVSNMLETLRVLSRSNVTYEHSIVLLLNGAEESRLKGTHPFLAHHPWAQGARAFINLDSAGSGGRECLFQVTPGHSWLMKYYKEHAPHPFAAAWMEELFQANLIPSDTDFRIFRDFGKLAGVDLATVSNGYVYHTRFDTADIIPIASYQNTGDNLLALTQALANAKELRNLTDTVQEDLVFFDYLGWSMITYSKTAGVVINSIVSVLTLIAIVLSLRTFCVTSGVYTGQMIAELLLITVVQIVSIILGALLVLGLAILYDTLHHSMSWFSNQWLIIGLYMFPFFAVLGLGPAVYLHIVQIYSSDEDTLISLERRAILVQMFLHVQAVLLIVLCVALTGLGVRSAFIVTVELVFYGASTWINYLTKLQRTDIHWIWMHLFAQMIPFMFYVNLLVNLLTVFIPVQGRSGSANNPEILPSIVAVGVGVLIAGFLIPLVGLVKRPARMLVCVFGGFWLISFIIMFSPVGFPYREKISPQRYELYHTDRTIHHFNQSVWLKDQGFLMVGLDRHANQHLDGFVSLDAAVPTATFCVKYPFCGLPLNTGHSLWLPSVGTANLSFGPTLELIQKRPTPTSKQFDFKLTGPSEMMVEISTINDATISNWTLDNGSFLTKTTRNGRISIGSGQTDTQIVFSIVIETEDGDNAPSLNIATYGTYYPANLGEHTLEYKQFLDSFPAWTHVTSAMISFESWQY